MSKLLNLIKNQISNPIKIILLKRKKKNDGYYYAGVQGNKMALDLNDKGLCREVALTGVHEPKSTEYIKKIVKPGMTIIDVGANIGYYALIEAKAGAKVFAIEPSEKNFEMLKKNIEINELQQKISVSKLAISDKEGEEKFYLVGAYNRNSLIPSGNNSINVKTISLDYYFKKEKIKKADLIRMDIEGAELKALNGMKNILSKNPPKHLFIELHPVQLAENNCSIKKVIELIYSYGYTIKIAIYESDPTSIKFSSVKEIFNKALASKEFFKTIFTAIRSTKLEKNYYNKEGLANNPFFNSNAVEVFFELDK